MNPVPETFDGVILVGWVGGFGAVVAEKLADGVEPKEFTAVTITLYVVFTVRLPKVALLDVEDVGVADEPLIV